MQLERKAMYNVLRMDWLERKIKNAQTWQVEDYRKKTLEEIFKELKILNIGFDTHYFLNYAEAFETPEELAESLTSEESDPHKEDHVYLLVFELWRRLIPEKLSLSIVCDELDYQIYLYDKGEIKPEALQNALVNLQTILVDNADKGIDPQELFQAVENYLGNDLETFLYDFISQQIEGNLYEYATELLDVFENFVSDKKWFVFLRIQVVAMTDPEQASQSLTSLIQEENDDLEFCLEVLQFLAHWGDRHLFLALANRALCLLSSEDEFQELLIICADYFQCLDEDQKDQQIQQLLAKRTSLLHDLPLQAKDSGLLSLKQLLI